LGKIEDIIISELVARSKPIIVITGPRLVNLIKNATPFFQSKEHGNIICSVV